MALLDFFRKKTIDETPVIVNIIPILDETKNETKKWVHDIISKSDTKEIKEAKIILF